MYNINLKGVQNIKIQLVFLRVPPFVPLWFALSLFPNQAES